MKITIGHTPDSDDAFMFYGLFTGKVQTNNFVFEHTIEDIENLNNMAIRSELDVTAISVNAYSHITNYTILRSGGSFGIGYGPILISKKKIPYNKLNKIRIGIPGKLTSAFLLLQLMIGKFEFKEIYFDEIPTAIRNEKIDVGLVIHETQLSYEQDKLIKIVDIGKWWSESTNLPVPLGVNVMKSEFGSNVIIKLNECIRNSIRYGLDHMDEAVDYAMKYSRGKHRDLVTRFIGMYVNNITVDMGEIGEKSIKHLFYLAKKNNLIHNNFQLKIS